MKKLPILFIGLMAFVCLMKVAATSHSKAMPHLDFYDSTVAYFDSTYYDYAYDSVADYDYDVTDSAAYYGESIQWERIYSEFGFSICVPEDDYVVQENGDDAFTVIAFDGEMLIHGELFESDFADSGLKELLKEVNGGLDVTKKGVEYLEGDNDYCKVKAYYGYDTDKEVFIINGFLRAKHSKNLVYFTLLAAEDAIQNISQAFNMILAE